MRPLLKAVERQSWLISAFLWVTFLMLIFGLLLPVMRIEKLVFWEDSYSIVVGTFNLFREGKLFLGLIIFLFSVLFPIVKLAGLGWIWFRPESKKKQRKILHWVAILGKWSMLDVFVVAVIVVLSGSKALGDTEPGPGLYVFSIAIFFSMILTEVIAKQLGQDRKASG